MEFRKVGWTPLYSASFDGHVDVVAMLLDNGADITVKEEVGKWAGRF